MRSPMDIEEEIKRVHARFKHLMDTFLQMPLLTPRVMEEVWVPDMDVFETDEAIYVIIDVAGLKKEDIDRLISFSETFGGKPYLALKIKGKWLFINPYLLHTDGKNYALEYKKIQVIAIDFKELIGEGRQVKFDYSCSR